VLCGATPTSPGRCGAHWRLANRVQPASLKFGSPPADWPLKHRHETFDRTKAVVDGLPIVNMQWLKAFDAAFAARP
jgi:hypothetical protein